MSCVSIALSLPRGRSLGGEGERGEVRGVYHEMVQSRNPDVRLTLAASLHEIAKFQGSNVQWRELIPIRGVDPGH